MARTWNGQCTIQLLGSSLSYSPPQWSMSGPNLCDRQAKTKEYIEQTWIDSGTIWKLLNVPATEQNKYCQSGGIFRVDYGIDKRPKEWQFTKASHPICVCKGGMTFA